MTITRRPPRPAASTPKPAAPARRRKTPESFIEDAHHSAIPAPATADMATLAPEQVIAAAAQETKSAKKAKEKGKGKDKPKKHKAEKGEKNEKRKDKEAVLIRFEDEQLTQMDERAADLGLSRAAWLRMVVSKALRGKKS